MHIGDPLEDLGWVCTKAWRFGAPLPAGGFAAAGDLLDGYAEVAGWRPAERDVLWWSVYGSIRWGTMCRKQADRHLSGSEQSLELALIGRRFAENELDVLVGLGLADPLDAGPSPGSGCGSAGSGMFGEPTVVDVLEAATQQIADSKEYRDRLLASALRVATRELSDGPAIEARLSESLDAAGYSSEDELAAAIRSGIPLDEPVVAAVRAGVEGRLQVWNPKYLAYPAPPDDFRIPAGEVR